MAARATRAGIAGIDFESAAFMAGLRRALAAMTVKSEGDLKRVGFLVQQHARELAPVDTGRLRSSIILTSGRDGQGFYVEVGTNVYYARFVEFGTRYTRAQPFLLPAVALASGYLRSAA